MKFNKLYMFAAIIFAFAVFLTCFDAKRDNPYDPVNNPNEGGEAGYDYYVSSTKGNDQNSGSAQSPFQSIVRALQDVESGDRIAVTGGQYDNGGEPLNIEGIEIYGGFFDDLDWEESQRDPEENTSIIQSTNNTLGDFDNPVPTVRIAPGESNTAIVDGFRILASSNSGAYSCAVRFIVSNQQGFSMILRNCNIKGNDSNSIDKTYGIFLLVDNSTPSNGGTITIENNKINAGKSYGGAALYPYSYAVYLTRFENSPVNVNIWNNLIDGGESNQIEDAGSSYTHAIYCHGFSPNIFNNTIYTGTPSYSGATGTTYAYGIYLESDGVAGGSIPNIINNIIRGCESATGPWGFWENDNQCSLGDDNIKYNNFFDFNMMFNHYCRHWDDANAAFYEFDFIDTAANGELVHNFAPIIYLGSENTDTDDSINLTTMHINDGKQDVSEGGDDLSSFFTYDKDGDTRTVPWSMGAYERDD